MSMKFNIIGTGSYLPDIVVTNEDMEGLVDTSDEWIRARTGIETRHFTSGEGGWYMAKQAANRALEAAAIEATELDAIIVTTVTPDFMCPTVSCILQHEIGATNAFCIDINVACPGFVYALDIAAHYLLNPDYHKILVVGAEVLSSRTDFTDRNTCVLFGDAASAVILSDEGDGAMLAHILGADGSGARSIRSGNNIPQHPFLPADWEEKWPNYCDWKTDRITMDGADVYRFSVGIMPEMVNQLLAKTGLTMADIDYMIPHQANVRIIDAAAKRLKYPMEKMYTGIRKMGNTSSAGLGVGIDECIREGRMKKGDHVILTGFGGGLSYGSMLLRL